MQILNSLAIKEACFPKVSGFLRRVVSDLAQLRSLIIPIRRLESDLKDGKYQDSVLQLSVLHAEVGNRVGNLADESEQLYKVYMQGEMLKWNIELGAQLDTELSEGEGKLIVQSILTLLEPFKFYEYMCT